MEEVAKRRLWNELEESCWSYQTGKIKGFFVLKRQLQRTEKIGEEEHVRYNRFSHIILEKVSVDQRIRVVIGSQG